MWPFRRKKTKKTYYVPVKDTYKYVTGNVVSIEVQSCEDFTQEDLEFYYDSINLTAYVVNSLEFKNAVLASDMILTEGMSNLQIYNMFISGKTVLDQTEDRDIDIKIKLYYEKSGVIGYTYPSTIQTWLNRRFFKDPCTICGNAVHEYMHKCGFGHSFYRPERNSVPYVYGDIADKLARMVKRDKIMLNPVDLKLVYGES